MLVSTNDACRLLWDEAGVSRDWARVLLTAGAAGPGIRVGRSVLHDVDRVRLLAARPKLAPADLAHAAPSGLFVGRLSRERVPDPAATAAEQRTAVSEPWPIQFRPRLVARVREGRISIGRGQALRLWGFATDPQARSTSSPSGV